MKPEAPHYTRELVDFLAGLEPENRLSRIASIKF